MKIILIVGAATIVALSILYFMVQPEKSIAPTVVEQEYALPTSNENGRIANPDDQQEQTQPAGKLKADTFTGTLQSVDTGCFADGECYIEVDDKHITLLTGMRLNPQKVGTIIGADGIGGLESFIGKQIEVYAQDNSDGTYTLYGSEGFYVKVR